jgi:hypothetical protein
MFQFPKFIQEMEDRDSTVLTHLIYHSWMLSDQEINRLEEFLAELSARKDISFITANQIKRFVPSCPGIYRMNYYLYRLMARIDPLLSTRFKRPGYHILDPLYHLKIFSRVLGRTVFLKCRHLAQGHLNY